MSRRIRTLVPSLSLIAVAALLAGCSGDGGDAASAAENGTITSTGTALPDGVSLLPAPDPGADSATLPAGRYRVPLDDTLSFEVTVPSESYAHDGGTFIATGPVVLKSEIADASYGVPRDACTAHTLVPAGTTVDDLVTAIRSQPAYAASRPRPVVVDTAHGTALDLGVPRSYDDHRCNSGEILLPGTQATAIGFAPGFRSRIWVLDVDGRRVIIQHNCSCSPQRLNRALPILESVTFPAAP